MNNAIHEMVRIETADLDAILTMPSQLPMRVGRLITGRARIYQAGDRFVLDLGDGVTQSFSGKRFKFPDHLHESYCIRCEKCRKWRKRLFLNDVSFGQLSQSFTHSLECKECIASADTQRRDARSHKQSRVGHRSGHSK